MNPTLSVVLPSYKRPDLLDNAVARLVATSASEIIVVLDGPQPDGRAAVQPYCADPRVQLVELAQNVGLALARIEGLRKTSGEYVMLVDDDILVAPDVVEQHLAAHDGVADRVVVGYMPVRLPARRRCGQAATWVYAREYQQTVDAWFAAGCHVPLDQLWNGNVSLSRRLYERAEASRPSIRLDYNEDLDLGLRLRECGAHAVFVPAARAEHLHRRANDAVCAESTSRGRSAAVLEQRWGRLPEQIDDLVNRDLGPLARLVGRLLDSAALQRTAVRTLLIALAVSGRARRWRAEELVYRVLRRFLAVGAYREHKMARGGRRDQRCGPGAP